MSTPSPQQTDSPPLKPLLAGMGLGLTLAVSYLLAGQGLGAFGFFRDLVANAADAWNPFWTADHAYLSYFVKAEGPWSGWIAWQMAGLALGGLLAALLGRQFFIQVERGSGVTVGWRLFFALLGGVLAGFGAALARGCTSGLGLSGGALLSTGAFVFLLAFFAAGLFVSIWLRRLWR